MIREKWENTITNNENRRSGITTDSADIKRIREYCEKSYSNKFDNLDERDKCSERHKLLKLMEEEIEHMNSYTSVEEFKFLIKNFPWSKL